MRSFEVTVTQNTHSLMHVLQQNWTLFAQIKMCCKQRWTSKPLGIVGNLNLPAMFTSCTEILPKRSGPLTPHVNCFHSVSATEWCGDVFFFFEIYLQECNYSYALSVHLFPQDPKHIDPQTRSSQRVRNSCHFQVSNHRYLRQTWQDSLFVSWACLLSGGRGSLRLL